MKRIRIILVALVLLFIIGGFLFWGYKDLNTPYEHANASSYIEIPRGSSPDEVVTILGSSGVIRRGWLLRLYIRATGAAPRLKAGEYRFPSPITPLAVLQKLQEGQQRLSRLTIVEGWTRWDLAALLVRIPELNIKSEAEALALMDDTSLIRDIDPAAPNLEGYLFPDTYSFPPNTSAREIIATVVRRFRQVWANLSTRSAAPLSLTPRQVVTLASLIETEAKLKEERPLVSSVIYNRLQRNMALGIDSSIIYASKLAGKWRNDGKVYQSDLDRESPYNTRKVRGLPPGPIASPGAASLEAALLPAQTDYLYYVREPSRDDGAHNFYSNESDFQRGVTALREWERTRNTSPQRSPTPVTSP